MRKPNLLLPALLLCMLGPLSAYAVAQAADSDSSNKSDAVSHTKQIYGNDCAVCHGTTGAGITYLAADMKVTLDDWTDPTFLTGKSDKQLFDIIRNGRKKMPAEIEDRASNEDVHRLIVYIRSMSKPQPVPPVTASPSAGRN